MGFRFRKIFSLGKGLRINIGKRGISTSLGVPGATLNIGKGGLRSTVGIPGSGLSYTSGSTSTGGTSSKNNPLANLIFGIAFLCLMFCCVFFCFYFYIFGDTSVVASTPAAPVQSIPIEKIIELTANAARAQTMAAMPPLPTSTLGFTPEAVSTPTYLPAVTAGAPFIVEATNTPIVYYSSTPFLYLIGTPPMSGGDGVCSCSGGLNCSNFSSQLQAQSCFNYCKGQGFGDVHGLDHENDGKACEGLP